MWGVVATSRRGEPFNSSWALHFPGEKPTARKALAVATTARIVYSFQRHYTRFLTLPPSPGDPPLTDPAALLVFIIPSPSYYLLNRKPWVTVITSLVNRPLSEYSTTCSPESLLR